MNEKYTRATQNRINIYRQLTYQKMPNHTVDERSKNGNNSNAIFPL